MSAFMVTDETINRVVSWLSHEINTSLWLKEKVENTLQIDTTKPGWQKELGKAMFELNIAGVNDRYGEGEAKKFQELNYRYTPACCSKIQALKSMQCWLYQCAEGEVVKKPLFQFFDTVIERRLTDSIICDLPEYQRAEWGLSAKTGRRGARAPRFPYVPWDMV
jgi:hypothetical protein